MPKVRLAPGVWTNAGATVLAGAGAVTGATSDQQWLQYVGWAGMLFGLGILAWGVTVDGEHWWLRALRRAGLARRARSELSWTFNELVRHVAYSSEWAGAFNPTSGTDRWQRTFWWKPLKKEVFRPLVSGDLRARGVLYKSDEEPDNGPTLIPTEFWRKADFFPQYVLAEPEISSASNGARGEIYDEIEVVGQEALALWPARSPDAIKRHPSPFIAWHREWAEEEQEKRGEVRAMLDGQVMQQRRHLIEQGREMVAAFRQDGSVGTEERFLEGFAAFSSLKKHLKPELLEKLGSGTIYIGGVRPDGRIRIRSALIDEFEQELNRLEDDWGLNLG